MKGRKIDESSKSKKTDNSEVAQLHKLDLLKLENKNHRNNIRKAGVLVWGKKDLMKVKKLLITFFHTEKVSFH